MSSSKEDYYKILGVGTTNLVQLTHIDKSVPDEEIKKAYRKLAFTYHPDKNPGDESAKVKFQEIAEGMF